MAIQTVILDNGHGPNNGRGGSFDPGAEAWATNEYTVVKRCLQGLEQAFKDCTPSVMQTPELSIPDVVDWINHKAPPDSILIAVHMNDGGPKSTGTEVVYSYDAPPERRQEAARIAEFVSRKLGIPNRGSVIDTDTPNGKPRPNGTKGLPILRDTSLPAFILELGFISNQKELQLVKKKGGQAIAELIRALGHGLLDPPTPPAVAACEKP